MRLSKCLMFVLCMMGSEYARSASTDLGLRIDLVNITGLPIKDAEISVRYAKDVPGVQRLVSAHVEGVGRLEVPIEGDEYAQVSIGDFLAGERKSFTFVQSIELAPGTVRDVNTSSETVKYDGYRARTNRDGVSGDCTEIALAAKQKLESDDDEINLVTGIVLSRDVDGRRLKTLHDWLVTDTGGLDPSRHLLPGKDHQYIILDVVEDVKSRSPHYRVNQKGIEVSLTFQ